jgi:thiol-disulfide isomerase/thioredoxin
MKAGRREALLLGLAGMAAAAAGFLVGPALLQPGRDTDDQRLQSASFPDLENKTRRLSEWRGKILVCNFWATWCAPCREEIPILIGAGDKYGPSGVQIVGIAIDNAAKVRQFSASLHISYPVLLAGADGLDLMRQIGNSSGGLPYTVIAGRQGALVHRKLGALKAGELDDYLQALTRA